MHFRGFTGVSMNAIRRLQDMLGAVSTSRELARHDYWPRKLLLQYQRDAITHLVRYAAEKSPFYAHHYEKLDFSGDVVLSELPPVDKSLLMDNFDDAVTDRRLSLESIRAHVEALHGDDYFLGEFRAVATAGTSGKRGYFVYDRAAWRTVLANTLRWNLFMGIRPRLPFRVRIASIGADNPMHVTERIPKSANVGLFCIQHFEATQPIQEMSRDLQQFQPEAILTYPSVAALLAAEQFEGRLNIAPKVVSTHSEVLTNDMRSAIHKAWGVSPFNHYGMTEEPHIAADCGCHEGLHIFEDTCIVEIVDDEFRPVPDGMPGARYLLTNLYNFVQPIIRYDVSDILTRAPDLCSCGRPFALISAIGGRSEDVLRLAASNGEGTISIPPLSVGMCIEAFQEVAEYTVSHSPKLISVTIVPREEADQAALRQALSGSLTGMIEKAGANPPAIEIVFTGQLQRDRKKMGKLRLVGAAKNTSGADA